MKFKRKKYGNKIVTYNGMKFDSIGERDRYIDLVHQQNAGFINGLQRQVRFPLSCNGVIVCHYVADFVYNVVTKDGSNLPIVEDYKGIQTDVFKLKAKMFKAHYGYDILITTKRSKKNYAY